MKWLQLTVSHLEFHALVKQICDDDALTNLMKTICAFDMSESPICDDDALIDLICDVSTEPEKMSICDVAICHACAAYACAWAEAHHQNRHLALISPRSLRCALLT